MHMHANAYTFVNTCDGVIGLRTTAKDTTTSEEPGPVVQAAIFHWTTTPRIMMYPCTHTGTACSQTHTHTHTRLQTCTGKKNTYGKYSQKHPDLESQLDSFSLLVASRSSAQASTPPGNTYLSVCPISHFLKEGPQEGK